MSQVVAFDIETGPLPDEQLPPFDKDAVALGNLKDPAKIKAKIEEAEERWRERLALSAVTGKVVAVGWKAVGDERPTTVHGRPEIEIIERFWEACRRYLKNGTCVFVGFNSKRFDLPFLVRRSMLLQVPTVDPIFDGRGYFQHWWIDLLERWQCGDRQCSEKLDTLLKAFGLEGKTEGITGADFAGLLETEPNKAIGYLERDVEATLELAEAMGL